MSLLAWIGSWPGAVLLQNSGTAYLFVNAAHILGIGLILGAILPLDLRLLGLFRQAPLAVLGPFLSRTAATGVALAILTGLWLFTVEPSRYLGNAAFLAKLALLALALGSVLLQHRNRHYRAALAGAPLHGSVRLLATVSGLAWLSALVAGRWIGFL
ncbi:DUF6644 family protein [Geminicoccus flavidas]|uniref:DUF6644 family protein n=1 Tax=Geminicoccus flavidas TaxID=2506407 RepID=UPI001357AA06|nr:DUF6644 family protein [Geminicoccus flavidas]